MEEIIEKILGGLASIIGAFFKKAVDWILFSLSLPATEEHKLGIASILTLLTCVIILLKFGKEVLEFFLKVIAIIIVVMVILHFI